MKQKIASRNENFWGPSPKCMQALRALSKEDISRYLEGYRSSALADRLAADYKVPREQVIVGYGSEALLSRVFDVLDPGKDRVLTHEHHYTFISQYLAAAGIRYDLFPMPAKGTSFVFDVERCIKDCRVLKPTVLIVNSPCNPTGNVLAFKDLARILTAAPRKTLVILDEAYFGFERGYDEKKVIALLKKHPNVMILRTFSKFYGLAGLRLSYALCGADVIPRLKYQQPYLGMTRLETVALAALDSESYYRRTAQKMIAVRERFIKNLRRLANVTAYDSEANFVTIEFSSPARAERFKNIVSREPVVIARPTFGNCFRVTIGNPKDILRLEEILRKED